MTKQDAYDLVLQISRDPSTRQQFISDPFSVLKATNLKLSESELDEVLGMIAGLSPSDDNMQKLYEKLQTNFADMALTLRQSVLNVVEQIETGFKKVMQMYVIAFYVGITLLAVGVISGLVLRENMLALVFGGLGTGDIVGYFVYKPAEDLQKSRGNLAQLEMAFINWIGDAHNWSEVFRQTFNQAKSGEELIGNTSKISTAMLANVKDTMKAIDDYCESSRARTPSK